MIMKNLRGINLILLAIFLVVRGQESSLFDDVLGTKTLPQSVSSSQVKPEFPKTRAASSRSLFTGPLDSQQLSSTDSKSSLFDSINHQDAFPKASPKKSQTEFKKFAPSSKVPVVTGLSRSVSEAEWKKHSFQPSRSLFENDRIGSSSPVISHAPLDLSNPFGSSETRTLHQPVNILFEHDDPHTSESLFNNLKADNEPQEYENVISKLSESVLHLGRVFQDKFLKDHSKTKSRQDPKTEDVNFTAKDLKVLSKLLKTNDKESSSQNSAKELRNLKRALQLIKIFEARRGIESSSIDRELELLLAKSLFPKELRSLTDLNRNEREAVNKVMKSMTDEPVDELLASGNTLSRTFEIPPENDFSDEEELVERQLFVFSPPNEPSGLYETPIRPDRPARRRKPKRPRPRPRPRPTRPEPPAPVRPPIPPSPVSPPAPVGPPSPVSPPAPVSRGPPGVPLPPAPASPTFRAEGRFDEGFFLAPDQGLDFELDDERRFDVPDGILPLEDEGIINFDNADWKPVTASILVTSDEDDSSFNRPLSDTGASIQQDDNYSNDENENHNFHYHYHIYSNNYDSLKDKDVSELVSEDSSQSSPPTSAKKKYASRSSQRRDPRRFRQRVRLRSSNSDENSRARDSRRSSHEFSTSRGRSGIETRSRSRVTVSNDRIDGTQRAFKVPRDDRNSFTTRSRTRLSDDRRNRFESSDEGESSYSTVPRDPVIANDDFDFDRRPSSGYDAPQRDPIPTYRRPPVQADPEPYRPPPADPVRPPVSYGPPPQAEPRPTYSPPEDLPTRYGPPPQADPAPMMYSRPQADPVPPAPIIPPAPAPVQTRFVLLRPSKKKWKKKHKKGLFADFFGRDDDRPFRGGLRDAPQRDDLYAIRDQRDTLRDDYWRSRERLENQQRQLFDLQRLETEIKLQEKQRDEVNKKILKKIALQGFGETVKSMFYKGASALGAMSLMPFRAFSRKKRTAIKSKGLNPEDNFPLGDMRPLQENINEKDQEEFYHKVQKYTISRLFNTMGDLTDKDLQEIQESLPPIDVIRDEKCLQQRLCFIMTALKQQQHLDDAKQFFKDLFPELSSNSSVEEVFSLVSRNASKPEASKGPSCMQSFYCSSMPLDLHWF